MQLVRGERRPTAADLTRLAAAVTVAVLRPVAAVVRLPVGHLLLCGRRGRCDRRLVLGLRAGRDAPPVGAGRARGTVGGREAGGEGGQQAGVVAMGARETCKPTRRRQVLRFRGAHVQVLLVVLLYVLLVKAVPGAGAAAWRHQQRRVNTRVWKGNIPLFIIQ